jgi:hypothetical protein
MEPHWNESRIKQVIGRVIRYKSHSELQPKDRHVMIYKWTSIFPKPINNLSADQYLIELSKKKDGIFNHFNSIIKDVAIENHYKIQNHKLKRYPGKKYTNIKGGKINSLVSHYNYRSVYFVNKYIYRKML